MMQHSFSALGTKWWIEIFDDSDAETLAAAFGRCQGFVETFEANYSRFLPSSKLSTLNREQIYLQPDSEWQDILTLGQSLFSLTDESFNILSGHILADRGYNANYTFVANGKSEQFHHPLKDLTVTPTAVTLRNGQVDIGGYGKGYVIDQVKNILTKSGFHYFLINGGGDMFGTSDNGEPILIYLEHPLETDIYLSETTLFNQGFAASSPFKRQWRSDNTTYSHIVSQNPILPIATYTKAASAVMADAFATTALILNKDRFRAIAAENLVSIAQYDPALSELWYTESFTNRHYSQLRKTKD
jgi:thiamine biosynthesis lipoprotein